METPRRIDPAGMGRLREWGGDALLRKMIDLFLSHTPERMARIEVGVAEGRAEEIERGAHSLKSSAANLGADDLRKILERVEQHAERQEVEAVAQILPALRQVYAESLAELRSIAKGVES